MVEKDVEAEAGTNMCGDNLVVCGAVAEVAAAHGHVDAMRYLAIERGHRVADERGRAPQRRWSRRRLARTAFWMLCEGFTTNIETG